MGPWMMAFFGRAAWAVKASVAASGASKSRGPARKRPAGMPASRAACIASSAVFDPAELSHGHRLDEPGFGVGWILGEPGVGKLDRPLGVAVEDLEKLPLPAALVVEVRRAFVEHAAAPLVLAAVVGVRRVAFVGVGRAELAEVLAAGVAGFEGFEVGGTVVGRGGAGDG